MPCFIIPGSPTMTWIESSVLCSLLSQTNRLPEFLILQEIRDPGMGGTSETIKNSEGFQIFPTCELIS